jgi:hypothetical protein
MMGTELTCTCTVPQDGLGDPISECSDGASNPTAPDPSDTDSDISSPTGPPAETDGNVTRPVGCYLTDPETDEELFFEDGESFERWVDSPCGHGTDFPCFCDVSLEAKVFCPYCRIPQGDNIFICAYENSRVAFQDMDTGDMKNCQCSIEDPSLPGTLTECSGVAGPDAPEEGCTTSLESGEDVFTKNGDAFGELIEGECGNWDEFPAFCNTDMVDGIEYPYCQYISDEGLVCAKDGETVTYTTIDGDSTSCDCKYTPENGPQSTCRDAPPGSSPSSASTPNDSPTRVPTEPSAPVRAPAEPPVQSPISTSSMAVGRTTMSTSILYSLTVGMVLVARWHSC